MYKVTELLFSEKDLFGKFRIMKKYAITDYYNNIKLNTPLFLIKEDATKYLFEFETTSQKQSIIEEVLIEPQKQDKTEAILIEESSKNIDESINDSENIQIEENIDETEEKPKRVKKTK